MAYLEEDELVDAYSSAKKYAEHWYQPFDEYERIAANLPSDALPPNYPKVTDGTLSALLDETPMRIWGQLQTGRVVALNNPTDAFEDWKTELANIIWTNKIIPNANYKAPFFSKLQIALHKALIYGSQPAFTFMVNTPGYVGSDFDLPGIRNIKMEPGKVSDLDSDYLWLDRHYTKLQLRGIIETASKYPGNAGWDIPALKKIYDSGAFTRRDDDSLTAEERKASDYGKVVTFSTCYHRGYGAPFNTIYQASSSNDSNIVRRQKNEDFMGGIPINFLYNKRNLTNPYGVGQIELAGPTQNMVDFFVAAHSLATQIGIDPPQKITGSVEDDKIDLDSIVFEAGAQWEVGSGDAELVNIATNVYSQFTQALSMYKTQVMNQQGTSDATVAGGDSGDSRYSKTPAGVKYQRERTNAKDNYLRQRSDEFVAVLAKNLINHCIQNMNGTEAIAITEEQYEKLGASNIDVPSKDHVIIEFDKLKKGEFSYDVDANSSIIKNDDETKDRLVEITKLLLEIPGIDTILAQDGKEVHVAELIQGILASSGLEKYEKVITDLSDEKRLQLEQAALGAGADPANGVPPAATTIEPPQEDNTVAQLSAALQERGWDEARIEEYINRLSQAQEAEVVHA